MEITDKRGMTYRVEECDGIYHAWHGDRPVIRAVLTGETISSVVVFSKLDRRQGIASALYDLIEHEAGIKLRPARIRTGAGKAFWAARRKCEGISLRRVRLSRQALGSFRSRPWAEHQASMSV